MKSGECVRSPTLREGQTRQRSDEKSGERFVRCQWWTDTGVALAYAGLLTLWSGGGPKTAWRRMPRQTSFRKLGDSDEPDKRRSCRSRAYRAKAYWCDFPNCSELFLICPLSS